MNWRTSIATLLLATASTTGASGQRVLEVSGDSRKLLASVEFLESRESKLSIQIGQILGERFDWFDIPAKAKAARIKIGELASAPFDLHPSDHTFIEVGLPKIDQTAQRLPRAVLEIKVVSSRTPVRDGATGWIYFGQLHQAATDQAAGAGKLGWRSLYLVKTPKGSLDRNNDGQQETVQQLARRAPSLRVDYPLRLRLLDANGQIVRGENDTTLRAGQYVKVTNFRDPEENGDVYAEVRVIAPPTAR